MCDQGQHPALETLLIMCSHQQTCAVLALLLLSLNP